MLLVNLGTPDGAESRRCGAICANSCRTGASSKSPRSLWQPILRGIVLTTRPKKSAHAYGQVWREDGSPLAAITRRRRRR